MIGKRSVLAWSSLVLSAVAAGQAPAVAAGPTQPIQFGLWSGGAYTNDQTGAFSHCVATAPYQSGISLSVVVNRGFGWSLGFTHPRWSLAKGTTIPIELRFGGGAPLHVMGMVVGAAPGALVEVPMPANSQLITAFRGATLMTALAQGQNFVFRLDGTSRILPMIVGCVNTALAAEASGARPSASSPPAPAASDAASLDEMRLATNFLLATRLANARVVGRSDVPAELASFGAVWKADQATGAVKIYPAKPGQNGLELASDLIARDAQACKGKFASARSSELVDSDVVFRASTSCADSEGMHTFEYFIAPWRNTSFAVFTVVPTSGAQQQDTTAEVREDRFKKAALSATR